VISACQFAFPFPNLTIKNVFAPTGSFLCEVSAHTAMAYPVFLQIFLAGMLAMFALRTLGQLLHRGQERGIWLARTAIGLAFYLTLDGTREQYVQPWIQTGLVPWIAPVIHDSTRNIGTLFLISLALPVAAILAYTLVPWALVRMALLYGKILGSEPPREPGSNPHTNRTASATPSYTTTSTASLPAPPKWGGRP
jgi:hypothetical protein